MAFVRTILGDIPAEQLGRCYAHEHIVIDSSFPTVSNPEFLLNDTGKIVSELKALKNAGCDSVIDSMPCDCGRNALLQAEVSKDSGIQIVVPTGLHLSKYYDPGHWSHSYSAEQLAELFISDIELGIDRFDYKGPIVDRLENRAGLIKIATDLRFTQREERIFEAAAAAHLKTGAPILTHTEQGTLGIEQADRLSKLGVDLTKVTLSHLDRKPDLAYHREILSTGINVEYDSAFRWKTTGNPTLELILSLYPEFPDQIMLGMDAAKKAYWNSYGGSPGLSYLMDTFSPQLIEAGLTRNDLNRIFISTPRQAYSFKLPNTPRNL